MEFKIAKQRFFRAKELRISISLMIIWSLLAGILFTYLTKELGENIKHGFLSFLLVFLGYVIVVVILALFFTHRLIGPFERLKMEMKLILAGDYRRRLKVRGNDDFYIKSFIADVNKLVERFEDKCLEKNTFRQNINTELMNILSLIEKEDAPKEKLKDAVLKFHRKVESLLVENKK